MPDIKMFFYDYMLETSSALTILFYIIYYRTKWQELETIAQIMNQTFLKNIHVMIQR